MSALELSCTTSAACMKNVWGTPAAIAGTPFPAMIADEGIPAQTIAPKFTGRFNKGVDYVGDVDQFANIIVKSGAEGELVRVRDVGRVELGAQNLHWEQKGAFTGEVSPAMLAALGTRYVIVGHSERRQLFGEDDSAVARKLRAVLEVEMVPILCVGETLEQRDDGSTEEVIGAQLTTDLQGLDGATVAGLVVAYEPIWAIGTGRTADADTAAAAIGFLRDRVREGWGEAADAIRILYGGSVNPGNIAGLMAKRDIDGALVGGASLDPDSFAAIVRYWV